MSHHKQVLMRPVVDQLIFDEMSIEARRDIMEKGKKLLSDPDLSDNMKDLVQQEMEMSKRCMEAFGLSGEVNA